ncbi:glycosyltransferase [Plantibacter sp. YIM 135249]|uniref:glycosyltransferase n=1 Tax=Plantibacter sp. YIM 135249 TaxID=3423918 RepID=UPI003D33BF68
MSDDGTTRLGIVVVNFGSSALIQQNLRDLDVDALGARVVVVDSFHSDAERAALVERAAPHGWELVLPATNVGFGGGMNLGVARASELGCTVFLLINPDAVITTDGAAALLERHDREPLELLAPRIVRPDGTVWFQGADLTLDDGRIRSLRNRASLAGRPYRTWLSGACLLIGLELWTRVGGFHPDYFMYWEDVDFSARVQDVGGTVAVDDTVEVVHDEGGTQSHGGTVRSGTAKSNLYYEYNVRNRMRFAALLLDEDRIRAWRRTAPAVAWEILLQGGRRQFLTASGPGALLAAARGLLDGDRLAVRALRDRRRTGRAEGSGPRMNVPSVDVPPVDAPARRKHVQLYEVVRTAHLERAAASTASSPSVILYERTRYDFDAALAASLEVRRAGVLGAFRYFLRTDVDVLEVNEPLQLSAMPRTAAALLGSRLRRILRGSPAERTTVVTYAIENAPPRSAPRPANARSRLKRRLQFVAARLVWHRLDRIVFGTEQAKNLYRDVFGTPVGDARLIEALPRAEGSETHAKDRSLVLFLGALGERKGFDLVLDAWPYVLERMPEARLRIDGKGELESRAIEAASADASIDVAIDPPRSTITEDLARARVLVLPSQPFRGWREQVGLPIVEALASGCLVVTTDQTGLAPWLEANGHRVINGSTTPQAIAEAVIDALSNGREPSAVLATLPPVDGRRAAEDWLLVGSAS